MWVKDKPEKVSKKAVNKESITRTRINYRVSKYLSEVGLYDKRGKFKEHIGYYTPVNQTKLETLLNSFKKSRINFIYKKIGKYGFLIPSPYKKSKKFINIVNLNTIHLPREVIRTIEPKPTYNYRVVFGTYPNGLDLTKSSTERFRQKKNKNKPNKSNKEGMIKKYSGVDTVITDEAGTSGGEITDSYSWAISDNTLRGLNDFSVTEI